MNMAAKHAKPKTDTPEPEAKDGQEAEAPEGFEHRSTRARYPRKD
ncbi:hypothetical protein ABZU32_23760 [Sphaerisporangium sp. NPDC005288]